MLFSAIKIDEVDLGRIRSLILQVEKILNLEFLNKSFLHEPNMIYYRRAAHMKHFSLLRLSRLDTKHGEVRLLSTSTFHIVIMQIHAALLCTLNEFVHFNAPSPIYYCD